MRMVSITLATALIAAPAVALTQTGTISGQAGEDVSVYLPMLDGPGVYGVTLRFDRPAATLIADFTVTWTFNYYCDFDDGAGFVYCGGDDVPRGGFYADASPGPQRLTGIYHIGRPYTRFDNAFNYETGSFYADYAYFNYSFADSAPVAWSYEVTRLTDVPEPASWTLLVTGFALAGTALRRCRPTAGDRSAGRAADAPLPRPACRNR